MSHVVQANVLISSLNPLNAVLCDFGASRISDASLSIGRPSSGDKGTTRWLAIELIRESDAKNYSEETDVWAFGMTVYVSVPG